MFAFEMIVVFSFVKYAVIPELNCGKLNVIEEPFFLINKLAYRKLSLVVST